MRTLTLALVAGLSLSDLSTAQGADLDYGVLRGPEYEPELLVIDWNGVYVGAHVGYTSTSQAFTNKFSGLINNYFTRYTEDVSFDHNVTSVASVLNVFERRVSGTGYGGFIGYNYQFDDTVIGVEFDYTRLNINAHSQDFRTTNFVDVDGSIVPLSVNGIASTEIVDYGTARVRGGYAIGSLMPFVTGGVAIGRAKIGQQIAISSPNANYNRLISDRNVENVDPTTSQAVLGEYRKTKVVGGVALGAGVEWALTQNVILRGEYQYVLFNAFGGISGSTASVRGVNMNTVRVGAAVKF